MRPLAKRAPTEARPSSSSSRPTTTRRPDYMPCLRPFIARSGLQAGGQRPFPWESHESSLIGRWNSRAHVLESQKQQTGSNRMVDVSIDRSPARLLTARFALGEAIASPQNVTVIALL
ncbi:unnamed protein product [Schistocephalus solidus]|uniref:Transposase n=1 Tax=Schistocephalus solidus TaxID=70667 RepID=A0A183T4T5_SCHSO|nr:unnamed protein product [Schistocephalus solidus]